MSPVASSRLVVTGFSIAAAMGFKSSAWIVVAGLAGHGVFDPVHGNILENSAVRVLVASLLSRV